MSRVYDTVFLPAEYCKLGDRPIVAPPLIDSSLFKLCKAGWNLAVTKRWVPSYGHTKLRYHFYDPRNDYGSDFVVYKKWVGYLVSNDELIHLLHESDLTPRFTRAPSFSLQAKEAPVVQVVAEEDEYEMIKRFNEERAKSLRPRKKRTTASVEEALERLDNVVSFPTVNEELIEEKLRRAVSNR